MLERKQNVFDAFIAAAEWLIGNGYTSHEKLAINGRSNGRRTGSSCQELLVVAILCDGVSLLIYRRAEDFNLEVFELISMANRGRPQRQSMIRRKQLDLVCPKCHDPGRRVTTIFECYNVNLPFLRSVRLPRHFERILHLCRAEAFPIPHRGIRYHYIPPYSAIYTVYTFSTSSP
jgi:hypothetical protein